MLVCPGQRDCTMSPDGSERGSTERHRASFGFPDLMWELWRREKNCFSAVKECLNFLADGLRCCLLGWW